MKYSLRSLMIVVALICVVLGGVMARIEYILANLLLWWFGLALWSRA